MLWKYLIRPILFRLDPEWVHYFSMNSFSLGLRLPGMQSLLQSRTMVDDPRLQVGFLGLTFPNPVGLAAGFDKDARWFHQLSSLGFSHIEVGTLTGQPQPGNPKKRLFRFPKDQAILNCMGFNNRGSLAARTSMEKAAGSNRTRSILGINIGLSKSVAVDIAESENQSDDRMLQKAIDDYLLSFQRLYDFADYFTINVSSPNTRGLRDLQHPTKIGRLVAAIRHAGNELAGETNPGSVPKPVLVKLAPDLTEAELDATLDAVLDAGVDGLIATNTTISDQRITTDPRTVQNKRCQCPPPGGGFSGRPLTEVSRNFVANVFRKTNGKLPIIGVGGIMTGEDAWAMIAAGASLVQVYTGFIYGGPFFPADVNRYLLRRLQAENISSITELVGTDSLA